ncbi:MAG: transglutaminase domain-containing protein [Planctomycetota bacterium]
MKQVILVLSLAILIACAAPGPCAADACRSVVLRYTIHNPGPRPASGVRLYALVPQNTGNQQILKIVHLPEPERIETDRWGQKIAVHSLDVIPAKSCAQAKMVVWATWSDKRLDIDAASIGTRNDIPEDIRTLYLSNRTKYQITEPTIKKIVSDEAGVAKDLLETARRLHAFACARVQYQMDDRWDDAVTVLKRGTGSCSEFTFAYISLCRAAGIPARYVGGARQKTARASDVDLWNHRWPEVYLPGCGWVPADRERFGVWPRNALILACGDSDDTPIGWDYKSGCTVEQGYVQNHFRAYWTASRGPEADERVIDLARQWGGSREEKLDSMGKLSALSSRLVIPFLADGLYSGDEQIVSAATKGLVGKKGRPVEVALVDALGKTGHAKTDAAILSALREVSGQTFANAMEWTAWLHSQKEAMGARIRAFIDGRSKLVLTRDYAQWFHYAGMPPGLAEGKNEPTFLENFVWKPRWARKERAYGGETASAPLRLKWPCPGDDAEVSLEVEKSCGEAHLLDEGKGRIVILFQNTQNRPGWFEVVLRFEKP